MLCCTYPGQSKAVLPLLPLLLLLRKQAEGPLVLALPRVLPLHCQQPRGTRSDPTANINQPLHYVTHIAFIHTGL